ncbi:hypothetical protein PENPOL_c002G03020 [Penicillium polonicum]|uniref:Uncharacterized protein n=1 Tax=Penicillium polonicum TaxID=60169 RepID=A0A1V6NWL0_PENPO|nr:hypothetical protein PENPOL_c002G03020 [Penicillium polonicum]
MSHFALKALCLEPFVPLVLDLGKKLDLATSASNAAI